MTDNTDPKVGSPGWKRLPINERVKVKTRASGNQVPIIRTPSQEEREARDIPEETAPMRVGDVVPRFVPKVSPAGEVNPVGSNDDTLPGDITPTDATRLGLKYNRSRQSQGFNILRDNRHGLWVIEGREDLGRFTELREAEKALDKLRKEQEQEELRSDEATS